MKKYLCILMCIIMSVSLCGCGIPETLVNSGGNFGSVKEQNEEILRCIKEKDKEGMKSLFCSKIKDDPSYDLDAKIDELFGFIDYGCSWSYEHGSRGGEEKSWREGNVDDWDVHPVIKNIDILYHDGDGGYLDKYYAINYYWHIVCNDDKSLEGIQYITVDYLNVESMTIGEYVG